MLYPTYDDILTVRRKHDGIAPPLTQPPYFSKPPRYVGPQRLYTQHRNIVKKTLTLGKCEKFEFAT